MARLRDGRTHAVDSHYVYHAVCARRDHRLVLGVGLEGQLLCPIGLYQHVVGNACQVGKRHAGSIQLVCGLVNGTHTHKRAGGECRFDVAKLGA